VGKALPGWAGPHSRCKRSGEGRWNGQQGLCWEAARAFRTARTSPRCPRLPIRVRACHPWYRPDPPVIHPL